MFRGGRTEYIRSPTNQTLKFILAFDDPSVSVRNANSPGICSTDLLVELIIRACIIFVLQREAKLQLFREAVDAYTELTTQVKTKRTSSTVFVSF